jgi:hypothetical protein
MATDKRIIGACLHGRSGARQQVFFNSPVLLLPDLADSHFERRYHALGRAIDGRRLHVTFTLRGGGRLIRVLRDLLRAGVRKTVIRRLHPGRRLKSRRRHDPHADFCRLATLGEC